MTIFSKGRVSLKQFNTLKQIVKRINLLPLTIPRRLFYFSAPPIFLGWYYYTYLLASYEIYFQQNQTNQEIIQTLGSVFKGFQPTFYLPNAFLQIVYGAKVEPSLVSSKPQFQREFLQLEDGGVVALDWLNKGLNKQVVIMAHGLTGGTDSVYMQHAAQYLSEKGVTVVCFNQRGVADSPLLTPRYHCHASTSDLDEAIRYISTQYQSLYGVGFSIGGNLMLKYAGQQSDNCLLKAIVSISCPFNLTKCSENIMKWQNFLYNRNITQNFINLLRKNRKYLQTENVNLEQALNSKNTYEFDEHFTRRLFNYKSIQELYDDVGCENYINNVRVPVLCIHSKDDPIVPFNILPLEQIKKNKDFILAITSRGGHVEWFTGFKPQRVIILLQFYSLFLFHKKYHSSGL